MLKRNKRGNTFWIIGEIVIVAAIIVIIFIILGGGFSNFSKGLNSCEAKHGKCMASCGNRDPVPAGDGGCKNFLGKDDDGVCCKLSDEELRESQYRGGEGANNNLISMLFGKETISYGATVEAEMDQLYKITPVLKYTEIKKVLDRQTPTQDRKMCSLYMKYEDSYYIMKRSKDTPTDKEPASFRLIPEDPNQNTESTNLNNYFTYESYDKDDSFVVECTKAFYTRYFSPSALEAGRAYQAILVVYDNEVVSRIDADRNNVSLKYNISEETIDMMSDRSHWAVNFVFNIKVKPIIEITDIGTIWSQQDDITVKSSYLLDDVSVALVSDEDLKKITANNIYERIYKACEAADDEQNSIYTSNLYKISGMKTGSEGFLGILGKTYQFPIYFGQAQPIEIKDKTAKIHFDPATIIYSQRNYSEKKGYFDLDKKNLLSEESFNSLMQETDSRVNHYLCVKAKVIKSPSDAVPKTVYAYSTQQLRLDISPPQMDNSDEFITVNYPKPFKAQLEEMQSKLLPGQKFTPYYFQEYPYIEITDKCTDKSGCRFYDYYFANTQVEVNVATNDVGEAAAGTVLGLGLNFLFQQIAAGNPMKTVCPLPDSGKYRRNVNTQIRFREQQGVFCLKISDGAGNYWMTWKSVYNPYNVIEKLIGDVVSDKIDQGTVPIIGS